MKLILVCCLAMIIISSVCADEAVDSDMPDFTQMRVKQLRALVEERGESCIGCVEKEHFIEKLKQIWHLPPKSPEEIAAQKSNTSDENKAKKVLTDEEQEEMMEQLIMTMRQQGIPVSEVDVAKMRARAASRRSEQAQQKPTTSTHDDTEL